MRNHLTTNRYLKTNHYNFKPKKVKAASKLQQATSGTVYDLIPGDVFLDDDGNRVTVSAIQKSDEEVRIWTAGSVSPIVFKPEPRGEFVLKKVTNVFRGVTYEWIHVETSGEVIICTREHPYYVEGKGWVEAGNLHPGDELKTVNGTVIVGRVWFEQLDEPQTTYNFEVEGAHNYFVGENGILVHNRCKLGERMKRQGLLDDTQDAHHLYPQKFRTEFENLGIDIDLVDNGIAMKSTMHRGALAVKYNAAWKDVIGNVATIPQAEAYMKQFMFSVYGILV